jgi:hypothetical protein
MRLDVPTVFGAIALSAMLAASCGGGDRDGTLCSRCSEGDPCNATQRLVRHEDVVFFCGDRVAQDCSYCRPSPDDPEGRYLCEVALKCHLRGERGTSARSCYPLLSDSSLAQFGCDGAQPDFNLP